jgi:glycosyltransferase involved in cell wall biosynthesis
MRVAILNSGHMDYGGTERVVAFQAKGLYNKGYEVAIFTPLNNPKVFRETIPPNVSLEAWWHTIPSPILKRTINRLLHFWFGGNQLNQFDLIIAHNQPAPYVAHKIKKSYKKRYIAYIHAPWRRLYPRKIDLTSGWASDYRERMMFLYRDYWYRLDKESIQGADAHLVNSQRIGNEVEQVYGVETEVCYPGIEFEIYQNFPKKEMEKTVEKYGIDEYTLLVVGRHAPQKRLEWIPKVINYLKGRFPGIKAVVTGEPNRMVTPKIMDEAKRLRVRDMIRLAGSIPEVELISLYHTCPILAYTTVYEDFGLPPIEAMACGCVPVAWDEGAGPCETIVDGETGLLAKPYDLEDFSMKIAYLLNNPREREFLARKGVANAKGYDWSNHISILEETIHKVEDA